MTGVMLNGCCQRPYQTACIYTYYINTYIQLQFEHKRNRSTSNKSQTIAANCKNLRIISFDGVWLGKQSKPQTWQNPKNPTPSQTSLTLTLRIPKQEIQPKAPWTKPHTSRSGKIGWIVSRTLQALYGGFPKLGVPF